MPLDIAPTHRIAQLSDTHLLAGGALLHDRIDTAENLRQAMRRLEATGIAFDAIVHTGDIADLGELDAYRRVREIVEPSAERIGCPVVWAAGNHDLRGPLREGLLGREPSEAPLDSVTWIGGLRIVSIDTSVPERGHGDLERSQLVALREVLAQPAPDGTLLAMHHPPVPTSVRVLEPFQLQASDALAEVLADSDVRGILAGHFHYPVAATFAGIPVFVGPATSYTIQVTAPELGLTGVDGHQAVAVTLVYPDRIASVLLPLEDRSVVTHLPDGYFET